MKNFIRISTSTLGGAAVMLILSSMLGDKAPWFISMLTIGDKGGIAINVEKIFDDKTSLAEIEKDKSYYTNGAFKFYVQLPNDNWTTLNQNPGKVLDGLSVANIPFFKYSLKAAAYGFHIDNIQRDEITTTTIYNPQRKYEIKLSDSSSIGHYPILLNPFIDMEYFNSTLKMAQELSGDDDDDSLSSSEQKEEQKEMIDKFNKIINGLKPSPQTFFDNVTITTFQPAVFNKIPVINLLNKNGLNLYSIQNILTYSNPELSSTNIRSFIVNKQNTVCLMETSVNLGNVSINQQVYPNCELARFVLIAVSNGLTYVVTMRYLNGVGNQNYYIKELESIFNSFRIVK